MASHAKPFDPVAEKKARDAHFANIAAHEAHLRSQPNSLGAQMRAKKSTTVGYSDG